MTGKVMRLFREYGLEAEAQDKVIARYIKALQHFSRTNIEYKNAQHNLAYELDRMRDPSNPQRSSRVSQLKQAIMELK